MNTDQKKHLLQTHNTSKSKSTHSCALRLLLSLAIAPSIIAVNQVAFAGTCTETATDTFVCEGDFDDKGVTYNLIDKDNTKLDLTVKSGTINNPNGKGIFASSNYDTIGHKNIPDFTNMYITQEADSTVIAERVGMNITNYIKKGETVITSAGKIKVDATGQVHPTDGIWGLTYGESLTIEQLATGSIEVINQSNKFDNAAINADNKGTGNTTIITAGKAFGGGALSVTNYEQAKDISITQLDGELIGDNYFGIVVQQKGTGEVKIKQEKGLIKTSARHGIYIENTKGKSVDIETAGTVIGGYDGEPRAGIAVVNTTNQSNSSVTIKQTAGYIEGHDFAIFAYNPSSNGNTEILTAGKVIAGTDAVYARNINNANDLLITQLAGESSIINGAKYGIYAGNFGVGKTELSIDGTVQGGQTAIVVNNTGRDNLATINIGSNGHVGELNNSVKRAIVTGGDFNGEAFGNFRTNINNAGTLVGTVQFGNQGNTMSNSGTWNTAGGSNEFGSDIDNNSFSNTGTVIMSMQGMGADVTTTFNGLKEFTNDGTVIAAKAPVANAGAPVKTTISGLPKFVNNSSGVITMANGVAGDHTIIDGDYHGNGGTIELDTVLGADDSLTDLLEITGNTSGSSNVIVHNAGGTGALTTADGIQIIKVGGSSGGDFTLAGDYVHNGEQTVVGGDGVYAYKLYQNGLEGGANEEDGNWYLRSRIGEMPTDPDVPDELYQAGAAAYEVYPQILLGLNGLPTLQQRVGNRTWSNSDANYSTDTGEQGHGFWSRIEGEHSKFKPAVSTTSATYTSDTYRIQAGFDSQLSQSDNSNLVAGVSAHYAHASANIKSIHGNGDIGTDAYGLSGTLTWYGNNGFYVDGQAQASWYKSDLNSDTAQRALVDGNKGFGYAFSVEAGQRIALKPRWSLTPQAQLVYSKVDFDDFTDPFDAKVSLDKGASLKGRLGVALDYEFASIDNNHTLVYGIANLEHEFLSGTKVKLANVNLKNRNERLWGNVGLGFSHNWKSGQNTYTIYAEGSVATSMKNFGDSNKLKGEIGFRMQF